MRPLIICLLLTSLAIADGPADNRVEDVRPMPPLGIAIAADVRASLEQELKSLDDAILKVDLKSEAARFLADVQVFSKAAKIALFEDGIFEEREIESLRRILKEGQQRASKLIECSEGNLHVYALPWRYSSQHPTSYRTVRGFRSRLDGSIQPYGVVIAGNSTSEGDLPTAHPRTDIWCRGRAEKGLEMQFLAERLRSDDPKPAPGVIMIHPFGRYCNANKLAGEVDTLEAIEHAASEYSIDRNQVVIRGFSMGGAAAWHLAVHYPDRWLAANPGAGFSETPKFLNVFQSEKWKPRDVEQKLWRLYDCPYWALNIRNVPTIAYSGAIDKQKQAADLMAEACAKLDGDYAFELTHIVAPRTGHSVEPNARREIERRLELIGAQRKPQLVRQVAFTTSTLKYNRCHWLTIDAIEEHWQDANVVGVLNSKEGDMSLALSADGVRRMTIDFDIHQLPSDINALNVEINSTKNALKPGRFTVRPTSDGSWKATFEIVQEDESPRWSLRSPLDALSTASSISKGKSLEKIHDLQGPIDDAFMSPFVFVRPSGDGYHESTDRWVASELDRAQREWHRQMRGDVTTKAIDALTAEDIVKYNLVLWGDPKSNPKLKEILEQLPLRWDESIVSIGGKSFDSSHHVPVMIYPNPLNPDRYVVINSSFTYREYDYLNNARQVPKLGDWAIFNIDTPPNKRYAGIIVAEDFFDEQWNIKTSSK